MDKVNRFFVLFFTVYVTIIVFAALRVITAVFLRDTLDAARNDDDAQLKQEPASGESYSFRSPAFALLVPLYCPCSMHLGSLDHGAVAKQDEIFGEIRRCFLDTQSSPQRRVLTIISSTRCVRDCIVCIRILNMLCCKSWMLVATRVEQTHGM